MQCSRFSGILCPLCIISIALVGGASTARAVYIRDDVPVASYNNLAAQGAFQAAGFVGNVDAPGSFCSGTLVSPSEFLTAAHCLFTPAGAPNQDPADLNVGFGADFPVSGLGPSNVASFSIDPGYVACDACARFDVAVIELSDPVNNITPARIFLGNAFGLTGTIIGYGQQANGFGVPIVGANNRLGANNAIDGMLASALIPISRTSTGLDGNDAAVGLALDDNSTLATDFDVPGGNLSTFGSPVPLPLEGTPCFGDSGGPLFGAIGAQQLLVGDVSEGSNTFGANCSYGSVALYATLADPMTVAYLVGLNSGIQFVVPEPDAIGLTWLAGIFLIRRYRARRKR